MGQVLVPVEDDAGLDAVKGAAIKKFEIYALIDESEANVAAATPLAILYVRPGTSKSSIMRFMNGPVIGQG